MNIFPSERMKSFLCTTIRIFLLPKEYDLHLSLFGEVMKYLGPGFILSASVVGSGELISTTALGARAGFLTFWVIIISCFVKVAIQLEFGKQAIRSGETVMASLNRLGGPRLGKHKTNWSL